MQAPRKHTWRPVQAWPQEPQFAVLLSAVSQPFAALPSQLPKPCVHVPRPQVPVVQVAPALLYVQRLPHAPQLLTLVCRFAHAPAPAQYVVPVGHTLTQVLPLQYVPVVQALPQAPQFVAVVSGASQPSEAMWLQSP